MQRLSIQGGEGMDAHFHRASGWASLRKGHVSKDSKEGEKKGAMQRLEEVIPGEGTASKSKGPGAGSRLAGAE